MKTNSFLVALVAFFFVAPCQSKAAVINEWEISKLFPHGGNVLGSIYVFNYGENRYGISYSVGAEATLYPVHNDKGGVDLAFLQNRVEVWDHNISIPLPTEPFTYTIKSLGNTGGFYWGDEWVPAGKAVIEDSSFVGWASLAPALDTSIVISAIVSPVPEPEYVAVVSLLLLGLGLGRKLFV